MVAAYIDRTDTLSMTEKNGVVRSLTRKCRVIFEPGEFTADFRVLHEALAMVPPTYTTLGAEGLASMLLVERSAELVEGDPAVVDVTLKYEHVLDGPNQQLIDPPTGVLYGKGRCSISEKTTNFFYPDGDRTLPRTQILVAHTYTNFDPEVNPQCVLGPKLPWTIIQGGEVNIPFPQANYKVNGVLLVKGSPKVIADMFVGCINEDNWLGDPPLHWICSEAQWEVLDLERALYRFEFEFQYNVDTWNPTVVFLDQRTGRPPPELLKATLNDANGVLRLVPNPLRIMEGVEAGGPFEAAAANAVEVLKDIVDAAHGAAFKSLTAADPAAPPPTNIDIASAAALNAATMTANGINFALFAQVGGDPVVLDLPGAVQGANTGMQAGNAAYPGLIDAAVADLNAAFPAGFALPIGGGQAITDIAIKIDWITTCSYAGSVGATLAIQGQEAAQQNNQPAGIWLVPALRKVSFRRLFGNLVEQ